MKVSFFFDKGPKFLIIVLIFLFSLIIIQDAYAPPPPPPPPITYTGSAHGGNSVANAGVKRDALSSLPFGLCVHCHEQHASINGSEPVPNSPAGPDEYLLFSDYNTGSYSTFCLKCHTSTGSLDTMSSPLPPNIQSEFSKTYNHDENTGAHSLYETFADISSNKHCYCRDCHSPHYAGKTKHTAGTTGNAISTTSPLVAVMGAQFSTQWPAMPSNWTTPLSQSNFSLISNSTAEYQICFKCHSGANTNVLTWGGSGAAAWTDVGLEFNPNNKAGHPVVTYLNNYPNSSTPKALAANQMKAPWNVNLGTQTMYCSDCHNTNGSGAQGPHGSAVKWMLAGTNKAWPYQGYANNGGSSGTYWRPGTMNTNNGTDNGLFCLNCHSLSSNKHSTLINEKSDHDTACVVCHIRIPHGGKSARLMADYGSSPMPSRYYPNGNGGGYTQGMIMIIKQSGNYSNKDYCYTNCGEHTSSISGEHW